MKLKLICPDGDPTKFEVVTEDGEKIEGATRITATRDLPWLLNVEMHFQVDHMDPMFEDKPKS